MMRSRKQKKRILYLNKTPTGGSPVSLFNLVKHLDRDYYEPVLLFYGSEPTFLPFKELGFETIIWNKNLPGTRKIRGVGTALEDYSQKMSQIYGFAKTFYRLIAKGDLSRAWQLRNIIKERRIDLVHLNQGLSQDGMLAAQMAGVPQLSHIRAFSKLDPLKIKFIPFVDQFVYVSRAMAAYFEEEQGLPAERGLVIPNGVDVSEFLVPQDTAALRQELNLAPDDFVIGSIGRLDWWKGHDFFLEAVAQVLSCEKINRSIKILIVGEADDTPHNQAYKEKLLKLTQTLGLSDHLIFTGFRKDIPAIMAMVDLVVHSATEPEPFGRVIIEALAARRPLVATAAGGILDIIVDGDHGLLVPPKDASAMAEAMKKLITEPQLAQTLAEAGYQRVLERFTIEKHAEAIEDVYQALLN